jgi:hypothetical protein
MKQIINEYSPILEGVEVTELKQKVLDYSSSEESSSESSSIDSSKDSSSISKTS